MRLTTLALLIATSAPALAQEATIEMPPVDFGNYDPTMSAKEAVLANWEMAASGIRAGGTFSAPVIRKKPSAPTMAKPRTYHFHIFNGSGPQSRSTR